MAAFNPAGVKPCKMERGVEAVSEERLKNVGSSCIKTCAAEMGLSLFLKYAKVSAAERKCHHVTTHSKPTSLKLFSSATGGIVCFRWHVSAQRATLQNTPV